MTDPAAVHTFWFGPPPLQDREEWFHGGPNFDMACRAFQSAWEAAAAGGLQDWLDAPESLLAYVILCDQIPRNIFREDARQFATDARALDAAKAAINAGWDTEMHEFERVFLYLPFEHAEDLAMQQESIRLYQTLANDKWMPFVMQHHDIIARFGRFPHRNAVLGRETTAEEQAFMDEHGRGF